MVASIKNTAFGLPGQGAWNLHSLTPLQTWICTAAMLLGRLEIFSVIVLFTRNVLAEVSASDRPGCRIGCQARPRQW